MVPSRPEVGVSSREGPAETLSGPPSWSASRSLVLSSGRAGLQVAWPPPPRVPLRPPCRVGPTREGKVKGREGLGGNLVTAPRVFKRPQCFGELCCLRTVCACACVYLPSNLSIYIYVCRNMGAKEADGLGDIRQALCFLPLGRVSLARVGLGCDTLGVLPQANRLARTLSKGLCI